MTGWNSGPKMRTYWLGSIYNKVEESERDFL